VTTTDKIPTPAQLTATHRFICQMDNHEPSRSEARGVVEVWTWPDSGEESYRIPDGLNTFLSRGTHTVLLLDDGRTVRPFYVTGWNPRTGLVTLGPMPVNVNPDGTPRMRADDPERKVDYSTFTLGPSRAYHLKIKEA
jgi:hypothetical protein